MSGLKGKLMDELSEEQINEVEQAHIRAFKLLVEGAERGEETDKLLLGMFGSVFKVFLTNIEKLKQDHDCGMRNDLAQLMFMQSCAEYASIGLELYVKQQLA